MEVLLLEDIVNVGKLGDLTIVKPGYARYLLNQKKALRASEENKHAFAAERAMYEEQQNQVLFSARKRFDLLNGKIVEIHMRASADGKLFGSVSKVKIIAVLQQFDDKIQKSEVLLADVIKTVGQFPVRVRLHHNEIVANLTVKVLNQDDVKEDVEATNEANITDEAKKLAEV